MKPKLITIVGPTAIGKTALSLTLANHYKCDIISADSRQFYKEMSIGTAVPKTSELKSATHHFIQHKSIEDNYSVGDFERDGIAKIRELHQTNSKVIMVGGSGLYIKAITDGLDDFPDVNQSIRDNLNKKLKEKGLKSLQEELRLVDEKTYNSIAIDNPHRIIRALEIYKGTGQPYSSFLSKPKKKREFETVFIGLHAERSVVYDRINQRVDAMMDQGLLDEVKGLLPYKNLNALNTVGYKELFRYLNGDISLDFAIAEIKKNTRRFAKRQFTWFNKNDSIKWFPYTSKYNNVIKYIDSL
ncbi:tRNA (adenosine(37)-N6)-dimethylallyltransferase MiaA [Winogradskyella sp. DF17]|uniref:tRNA dimethylallyltransferase n=1 Tax=Winogradskyella pelagia TaxID=2819984 RepID=A0ABS3T3R2_9FLAO|nr:tRNA (adenosine(37)-N6)-dimethylallyltransferase MiaA [Winogradskyella sp. DF17]MBO3117368.1 tRNA (adenosine(37)-N6)-dimethylallyltransferase MiaA [Winogradskyella sp. DF17]